MYEKVGKIKTLTSGKVRKIKTHQKKTGEKNRYLFQKK
jgi:hypothetical protein